MNLLRNINDIHRYENSIFAGAWQFRQAGTDGMAARNVPGGRAYRFTGFGPHPRPIRGR